jgi:hypothetical protein
MWARAGHGLTNLAMQQLVDCDHLGDHGCGGGNPPNAYTYLIDAGGQDSYSSYPYTGQDGACRFNPGSVAARIRSWGYVRSSFSFSLFFVFHKHHLSYFTILSSSL